MTKLQVTLDQTEATLLAEWAASELRDPRDQIRLILRRELERRGLLACVAQAEQSEVSNHDADEN